MSQIKPSGIWLLVRENKVSEKTSSAGLVLTQAAIISELKRGTVLAVGAGERSQFNGELVPIDVAVGDTVIYNGATTVTGENDEKLCFVNSKTILGMEGKE